MKVDPKRLRKLMVQAEDGYLIPCRKSDGTTDLMARATNGDTLLHVAVGLRDFRIIDYLLTEGLDINAKGDFHATPLYQAAQGCDLGMVGFLLQRGADPEIPDHRGTLPHEVLYSSLTQYPLDFLQRLSRYSNAVPQKIKREAQHAGGCDGEQPTS